MSPASAQPDGLQLLQEWPLVSIVTPSFNQAQFLRDSIESVLAQSYPHLDYLVVDGGSTDGSVEILRSYGPRIRWLSEPDEGQSDAIAKGFERTRGDVLAWINSDDRLLPNAIERAVATFRAEPSAGLVYSNGMIIDDQGREVGPFEWIEPFDLWRLINFSDFILQPSAFFRRNAYEAIGGLDRSLHFAMDWDLWIRLAGVAEVVYLEGELLACSRVWHDTKTSTGGWRRIAELSRLARRHAGRRLTPAVKRYALDTLGRQLRARLPRSLFRLAVRIGTWLDARILRRMPAHSDGWLGPRGEFVFPRRWGLAAVDLELPALPESTPSRLDFFVDGVRTTTIRAPGFHRVELVSDPRSHSAICRVRTRARGWLLEPGTGRALAARLVALGPASVTASPPR